MSKKEEIEQAVDAIGMATIHPIGVNKPDGSLSLVIGGLNQWANETADNRAKLYHALVERGVPPNQASFMASWEPLPPKQ